MGLGSDSVQDVLFLNPLPVLCGFIGVFLSPCHVARSSSASALFIHFLADSVTFSLYHQMHSKFSGGVNCSKLDYNNNASQIMTLPPPCFTVAVRLLLNSFQSGRSPPANRDPVCLSGKSSSFWGRVDM